jgi:hypothetical protein
MPLGLEDAQRVNAKNNELKAGVIFIIVLNKLLFFCLISYGFDISKNFLHVKRKRLSATVSTIKLSKRKTDDSLQILHTILFGRKAKVTNRYGFLVWLFWFVIHQMVVTGFSFELVIVDIVF